MVEGAENLETEGGYAKEASEEFKKKQEELLAETLKKIDIVICTALIPGKKAPIINNTLSGWKESFCKAISKSKYQRKS